MGQKKREKGVEKEEEEGEEEAAAVGTAPPALGVGAALSLLAPNRRLRA